MRHIFSKHMLGDHAYHSKRLACSPGINAPALPKRRFRQYLCWQAAWDVKLCHLNHFHLFSEGVCLYQANKQNKGVCVLPMLPGDVWQDAQPPSGQHVVLPPYSWRFSALASPLIDSVRHFDLFFFWFFLWMWMLCSLLFYFLSV